MTETAAVVLVIEDEPQIRRFLRATLEANGYRVLEAETGRTGVSEAANHKPDLLIVDLGLPDIDGLEVVRKVRAWSALPIIVLSARSLEAEKVAALDAGADDYVTKPFGVSELLARLRVAFRHRAKVGGEGDAVFELRELRVDLAQRKVTVAGREVHLTPIEYRLLAELTRHAGKVLTHRHLLNAVWGPSRLEQNHYLRIYMAELRHKLEADPAQPRFLLTEAGVGYRLAAE